MEDKTECTQCLTQDNKSEIATGFCVICIEYLCNECTKNHGKTKATRNHKLLAGEHLPQNTDIFRKLSNTLLCKTHAEREVQFECKDHSEFICALCVRTVHRHCENVDDIDELVNEEKDKESCKILLNRYEDQIKRVGWFRKRQEEHVEELLRQKETYDEERKVLFQQLHESLDKLDKKYDNEVDENIQMNRNLIQASLERCCQYDENRKQDYELLALSLIYANPKQLAVLVKTMTTSDFESLDGDPMESKTDGAKSCQPSTWNATLTHVRDTVDRALEGMATNMDSTKTTSQSEITGSEECELNDDMYSRISMQDAETQTILTGEDKLEIEKSPEKIKTRTRKTKQAENSSKYQLKRCQAKPLMERKIKLTDTFSSKCATDCIILPDSRFVFVDDCYIKVYDEDLEFLLIHDLSNSPYSLCGLNEDKIAVTYFDEMKIDIFVISEDTIMKINSLSMEWYCRGITAMSGRDQCVAVLCSDNKEFSTSYSVKVKIVNYYTADLEDSIYCSDVEDPILIMYFKEQFFVWNDTYIKSFDMQGNELDCFKGYRGHQVSRVTGITADNEGNLNACCRGSSNVHQIRAGNIRDNRVLIEKICEPMWIVFDANKERLVIGCHDDRIRVYKFQ